MDPSLDERKHPPAMPALWFPSPTHPAPQALVSVYNGCTLPCVHDLVPTELSTPQHNQCRSCKTGITQ